MSKHSSDSNSRDRDRSYNHRHSRRRSYDKKSKHRHRSNSSSDYSSRHKHSSRTRETSHSKKSHRRQNSSSSNGSASNSYSNTSKFNQSKSSKTFNGNDNKQTNSSSVPQADVSEVTSKDKIDFFQQNVDDTIKMEKAIEEINQEGFVFKVFKSSSEQKEDDSNDCPNLTDSKLNEDIINSLPVEKSTFVISNQNRLLCAKYTLLTKQERCLQWAKFLFSSYEESEKDVD